MKEHSQTFWKASTKKQDPPRAYQSGTASPPSWQPGVALPLAKSRRPPVRPRVPSGERRKAAGSGSQPRSRRPAGGTAPPTPDAWARRQCEHYNSRLPPAPSHLLPLRGRLGSMVIPALSARPPPAGRVPACGGSGAGWGAERPQRRAARREAARPSRAQGRGARRRPRLWRSVELFSAQVLSLPPPYGGSGGAPFPARRWLRRSAASARHSERPPARPPRPGVDAAAPGAPGSARERGR